MSSWGKIINREQRVKKTFSKTKEDRDYGLTEVPAKLVMHYREDCDIFAYHRIVIKKIENDMFYGKNYSDDISLIELTIEKSADFPDRVKTLIETKNKLVKLIEEGHSKLRLKEYMDSVKPVLEEYKKLKTSNEVSLITVYKSKNYIPSDEDIKRIGVIRKFYNIASKYIAIDYYCTGTVPDLDENVCKKCLTTLPYADGLKNDSRTCSSCFMVNTTAPKCRKPCKIDGNGILTTKSDDTVTFERALSYYEGRIPNPQVDREYLYLELDKHFAEKKVPTRYDALKLPLNNRGQRKGTDVQMMIRAFKSCGYKEYNEVYYICNVYWGYVPVDISTIKDICIEDRKRLIDVWNTFSVNERGRKSSISIWLWVWYHSRNRGHHCELSDFKLPAEVQKSIVLIGKICERCDSPDIRAP